MAVVCVYVYKRKTAYEILSGLVGSEKSIRDSDTTVNTQGVHVRRQGLEAAAVACPKVRAARWLCVSDI